MTNVSHCSPVKYVNVMAKFSAYPSLDSLVDLACRDGVDIRPTLLRVLTDLYVQKPVHSAEEETQYIELARGLIDAVDATTLAVVADRLSAYPAAPAAILARLGIPSSLPAAQPTSQTKANPTVRNDLLEIFFAANSEERGLILTNLDVADETAGRRLAAASLGSAATRRAPTFRPGAPAVPRCLPAPVRCAAMIRSSTCG